MVLDDGNEWDEWCSGRVASSSSVAAYFAGYTPDGTPERQLFGKRFERAYSTFCYRHGATSIDGFERAWVETGGNDGLAEATAIAAAFIAAGIRGLTPPTRYRAARQGLYISAKPDLQKHGMEPAIFEFKVYGGGAFATMQSKVFSWVLRAPVILVTWDGASVGKETVDGHDLDTGSIPDELFDHHVASIDAWRVT